MNISMPEAMREWIERQASAEGYGTISEYFRALVREDQKRNARRELDRKLIDALDSGPAAEMTGADWHHIRSTVRQRLAEKGKKKAR